jgi:N-acetylglucosaminyldiphosphoundecaprenol N-acetyl-beta-D-mannosaminyltransferase
MKVIGTELFDKGIDQAVTEFLDLLKNDPKNLLISPSDANVLVMARRNPDFREILHAYFWNLPDGVPSVWILKLKGAKKANRCSGPDFFKRIIQETSNLPVRHFLCGGAEGTADLLKIECEKWGNHQIVGTFSPPFKPYERADYKELATRINESKADIVWIGLGAPKQIYFSNELAKYTNVHFIVPIGAAFDFHTHQIKKAPRWIQKIGMEWCYRIFQEPKRLLKRYLKVVPLFIWYNFLDLFSRKEK